MQTEEYQIDSEIMQDRLAEDMAPELAREGLFPNAPKQG